MNEIEIYLKLKEIVKDVNSHSDQLLEIAHWVSESFEEKQPTDNELDVKSIKEAERVYRLGRHKLAGIKMYAYAARVDLKTAYNYCKENFER